MKKDGEKIKLQKLPTARVCSYCGNRNHWNVKKCKRCGKRKFEPKWVLAKRTIHRQLSVQVTRSNPEFGAERDRITLSKWWPGGRSSFNILSPGQWTEIQRIINEELGPLLGWETPSAIIEAIRDSSGSFKVNEIEKLAEQHPRVLVDLISAIDVEQLGKQEFSQVVDVMGEISDVLTNANAGFREAFLSVVKTLPKQKQRALEDLELLLGGWSLQVITNVAQQVKSRLEVIELFEKQIQDDRTFEIKGKNSIHRILERSMWLVDERYWIIHSDRSVRTFIGDELSKRDKKKYGTKRPDFVCGSLGNKLIILELKRPSHKLTVDDLNQLETYVLIARKYKSFRSFEAFLVGRRIDDELQETLKLRSNAFKVLTYADVVGKTKERYHEFLQQLDEPE